MAIGVSANKLEILQIARAVAQEKMIDESIVLEAIEEAIQKAARSRYGAELDIHCNINPKTGEMRLTSRTTVVEEVENEAHQITLDEAQKRDPEAEIGSFYEEELPPIEFGRVASQTAKQVITQKVREAERQRQFERVQGSHWRDRQRHRQARRIRQCHHRSGQGRSHYPPLGRHSARKPAGQ
jgi:N utilization substance protein A